MKTAAALSIVSLCAGLVYAQDFTEAQPSEEAPSEPLPQAAPQKPASMEDTAKPEAAFSPEDTAAGEQGGVLRDPFWPVGFIPKGVAVDGARAQKSDEIAGTPQWAEAIKQLSLSGIMNTGQGTYVAIVNGQAVSEGDTISVFFSGRNYTWTVRTITPKNVDFAQLRVQ